MANSKGNIESSDRFYFLGPQKSLWAVTIVTKLKDACSLDNVLKNRHHSANKGLYICFPVVVYRGKSWTTRKAECWRIDTFKLCVMGHLRVPWTERKPNSSILNEISPEYSLEGLLLKLKLPYFGHLMWRAHTLEKILMLGKIEDKRRGGWWRVRWLDSIIDSMDMSLRKLQEIVNRGVWCATQSVRSQRVQHDLLTKKQENLPFGLPSLPWVSENWLKN